MKKISVLSVFAVLTLPALAEENVATIADYEALMQNESVVTEQQPAAAEQKNELFEQPKIENLSNPKIRFPHGMQFGVGISPTSGLNGFIGYNNKNFDSFWAKRFGIRFDFATMSPIKSKLNKRINKAIGDEGVEIEDALTIDNFKLDAKHYGAMIDFYPFGDTWFLGGWRLTGGYVFGNLKMTADLTGEIDGLPADKIAFKLGGEKYYYDGNSVHATADAKWKVRGPYAGTGFDIGIYGGFKIFLDAGIVFTSNAAEIGIDVPFTNLHKADGTPVNTPALQAQVEAAKADALKKAQDKLDEYKFFPMVKLGFMYRF